MCVPLVWQSSLRGNKLDPYVDIRTNDSVTAVIQLVYLEHLVVTRSRCPPVGCIPRPFHQLMLLEGCLAEKAEGRHLSSMRILMASSSVTAMPCNNVFLSHRTNQSPACVGGLASGLQIWINAQLSYSHLHRGTYILRNFEPGGCHVPESRRVDPQ